MINQKISSDAGKLVQKDDEIVQTKPTYQTFCKMLKYTGGYKNMVI